MFVDIPGGSIELRDEGTRRSWTVALEPFQLASVPVTRALYLDVIGELPCPSQPAQAPVTDVSWLDAAAFCNALSQREGLRPAMLVGDDREGRGARLDLQADGYRLPTEAEWEHACRAGSTDVRPGALDDIAWHRGNSGEHIHPVGTRAANVWGLHDMIGNAWEWCWDVFDPKVYGPYRVFRGGGWCDVPRSCRASCRRKSHPTFRIDDLGFRLARSG